MSKGHTMLLIKYLLLKENGKISNYMGSAVSRGMGYEKIGIELLLHVLSPIKNLRTIKPAVYFIRFYNNNKSHTT